MRVVAGILTYKPDETYRRRLAKRTWDTLYAQPSLLIHLHDHSYCEPSTIGAGINHVVETCLALKPDIVVRSDDDIEWRPDAIAKIVAFWKAAPADVAILGCHIEPEYPWSKIVGRDTVGGVPILYRETVPGGSWSFRASMWPEIGPVPDATNKDSDVPTCRKLVARGYRLAQADLATHIGAGKSIWGNDAHSWDLPLPKVEVTA